MFTKTAPTNVTLSAPSRASCMLSLVLVGGGGAADYGGGGSGYVEHVIINMASPMGEQFRVKVGRAGRSEGWGAGQDGRPTSIDWLPFSWNEDYFKAAGGQASTYYDGGDGYSGGGGGGIGGSSGGGSNGSDGLGEYINDYNGKGSGLDLSTIPMDTFSLSPGAGGLECKPEGVWPPPSGGGGGGVLVNGEGPQEGENSGQGYGGGASSETKGAKGVVLMEIKDA